MTSIRPTGIDHAAAALRNLERRQDVIANNLANVSTAGFKAERVFARLLDAQQTATVGTATDLRTGTITTTNAPLDLAMDREGFFVVDTPDGEQWTRGGAFGISDKGVLVDSTGNPVLGQDDEHGGMKGPITIPSNTREVRIDSGGAVIADGVQIARMRVERAGSGEHLDHVGNGHFKPSADRSALAIADRSIRQGALEESNVSSMDSMVDLISVQRAYASVQKVLTTIDSVSNLAATEIGRPA
jgi:flagellar basal body rod protein FlgG